MFFKYFICVAVCLFAVFRQPFAQAENTEKIVVVTTFTILEDLTRTLGGRHVDVINLVGPDGDGHLYQPRPADAVAISKADLVIANGLGFEGWIERLIDSAGYREEWLNASQGAKLIQQAGEVDPHAWQSTENIRVYARNITGALIREKPAYQVEFEQHHAVFARKLDALDRDMLARIAAVPKEERVVVTSHDAFAYFGDQFGIQFLAPVGLSTDAEASAADVARLIRQIRARKVRALFVENISNPRLLEQIAQETGVALGGRLYSDALSEAGGPAESYLAMMRYNLESIASALLINLP